MSAVTTASQTGLLRRLPSVDELLRAEGVRQLAEREGHAATAEAARAVLARLRAAIQAGRLDAAAVELTLEPQNLAAAVERELRSALAYSLHPIINATGVLLHTNLGRAPLPAAALEHIAATAGVFSNLEFDVERGARGQRDAHAQALFHRIFAAELGEAAGELNTVVVNNNAAAVLLALNTLAEGGEVVVSRGELVEIGGSFRIPDVMAKSGALLREVGTTNRTRIEDYERALTERTRLLLRVHRSNFQIVGFTEQPPLEELVALARRRNLPLLEDLGSGALIDLRSVGISGEPGVAESLRAGVDVVTYSGDKLLGGPQAGLLTGRKPLIAAIRANALFRALRVDKLTYAALEATLLAYLRKDHDSIPALRLMLVSVGEIRARAVALAQRLAEVKKLALEVCEGESLLGGGSAPAAKLPTVLLAVACAGLSADELSARLRQAEPPVAGRVEEGRVLLDLRTVFPQQDELVAGALLKAAG
jgi:L-seryl-tRNA(Ser) seleniumtransferase